MKLMEEDGGWRMEDGGWRMEDGGWRMEDILVEVISHQFLVLFSLPQLHQSLFLYVPEVTQLPPLFIRCTAWIKPKTTSGEEEGRGKREEGRGKRERGSVAECECEYLNTFLHG